MEDETKLRDERKKENSDKSLKIMKEIVMNIILSLQVQMIKLTKEEKKEQKGK